MWEDSLIIQLANAANHKWKKGEILILCTFSIQKNTKEIINHIHWPPSILWDLSLVLEFVKISIKSFTAFALEKSLIYDFLRFAFSQLEIL